MNPTGKPAKPSAGELRPAKATDLPLLFRAELQYMREVERDQVDRWMSALDRNLELWTQNLSRPRVFDFDGVPAGIMLWMPTPEAAAVLVTIHVLPRARRSGIGTLLLQQFITDATVTTAEGHSLLTLGVHENNPIRSLYEQTGFRFTRTEGQYLIYTAGR